MWNHFPPRARSNYYTRMDHLEIRGQTPLTAMHALTKALPQWGFLSSFIKDVRVIPPAFKQVLGTVWSEEHAHKLVDTCNTSRPQNCFHIHACIADEQGN
jgi:hypothetical protein